MKVSMRFEKRDAWVGVFWDIKPLMRFAERKSGEKIPDFWLDQKLYEIYICILPFLPIKISWMESLEKPLLVRPATPLKEQ